MASDFGLLWALPDSCQVGASHCRVVFRAFFHGPVRSELNCGKVRLVRAGSFSVRLQLEIRLVFSSKSGLFSARNPGKNNFYGIFM